MMAKRVDPTQWDEADDDLLEFLEQDGVPVEQMTWAFGRTVETIERELVRLRSPAMPPEPAAAEPVEAPPAAAEVVPVDRDCRRSVEVYLEAAGPTTAGAIAADLRLPLDVVSSVLTDARFRCERNVYRLART
ncbi:MAG: hypothetical protein IT428_26340 [Planctomycetaceae bacterium]|nr:hypothetical protein [Planctomycetaceae bacterium]